MLVILGCGKWQRTLIEKAHELGLEVCGMDSNPEAYSRDCVDTFIVCDVRDPYMVVHELMTLGVTPIGCLTTTDSLQRSVGLVNTAFGLVGPQYHQTVMTTDKLCMKSVLSQYGVHSPKISVNGVRKPVWDSSSRGVVKTGVKKKGAFIEEHINGIEHTVDGYVNSDGVFTLLGVSDKGKAGKFSVSTHIEYPSETDKLGMMTGCIQLFVNDIGLESCPIHAEMIETPETFYVIEIASRMASGLGTHLIPYVSDTDYVGDVIRLTLGETLEPKPYAGNRHGALHFFTPVGKITSITYPDNALLYDLKCKVGDTCSMPTTDSDRVGFAIYTAETRSELHNKMEELYECIRTDN